jgi:phosphatidylinositol glycan class B
MKRMHSPDDDDVEVADSKESLSTPYRRTAVLAGILGLALLLRVWFGWRYLSLYHPDELFQSMEPAHRLVFGYGVITWEWRYGIRSWLLPLLLSPAMRIARDSPLAYVRLDALLLSVLSLGPVAFVYLWIKRRAGEMYAIAGGILAAVWFPLVYFAPRALSEVVATDFFCMGLIFADMWRLRRKPADDIVGGLLFGLVAALRIQLIPAVLCALFLLTRSIPPRKRWRILGSFAAAIALAGCFDWITLGHPFQSAYLYIGMNILQGRARHYGVLPWYWYFKQLRLWLGGLIPLALLGVFRSSPLAWIVVAIITPHLFIAHKEFRYLYPTFPLFLVLAILGMALLVRGFTMVLPRLSQRFVPALTIALASILVSILAYRAVLTGGAMGLWMRRDAPVYAFLRLNRDPGACGLALYGVPWDLTPGYSYLHRPIPIFLTRTGAERDEAMAGANRLLTTRTLAEPLAQWKPDECWGEVCLYHRDGDCKPAAGLVINRQLQSTDD